MSTIRWRVFLALVVALGLVAAACGDDADDDGSASDTSASEETSGDDGEIPEGPTIRIRPQDFSENVTINEVYGQYLEGLGYPVEISDPLGFRDAFIEALQSDDIDMVVDYIGGSFAQLSEGDSDIDQADPDALLEAIQELYGEFDVTVLDYSPAVDGDAFVVRGDTADENDLVTISDVEPIAGELTFGASEQCFTRPQCLPGLQEVYGLEFGGEDQIEFGSALGEALKAEEIDVTIWNTTAPQIPAEGFVILEDDMGLFPAQNIAPVVRDEIVDAYGDDMASALNELSAMITTDDLVDWNTRTDIDFEDPADVASDWLESNGLL